MNPFIKTLLMLVLLAPAAAALADDTDIYAANTDAVVNPNVLVVIDNSSNWAAANQGWQATATCPSPCKQGQAELQALRYVSIDLLANLNLGLMMFSTGAIDGAYVRWAMRPMSGNNTSGNKGNFLSLLGPTIGCSDGLNLLNKTPNCIVKNFSGGANNESINAASTDYSAAMFEAFKYLGGHTSPALADQDDPNGGTPVSSSQFGNQPYATLPADITTGTVYKPLPAHKYDAAAYSADLTNYISPTIASCAKNYLIFIGNGYPTQDSPASLLSGVGGDTSQELVPDFVTVSGNVPTQLGTEKVYASELDCIAAAQTTYGTKYDSYSCTKTGDSATTISLGTSSCGQYASATACMNAISQTAPGHGSYSCTIAGSCTGSYSLGNPVGTPSACGAYTSAALCEAALPALYPGYTGYTCAPSASTCTPSTVTLNSGTGHFAAGQLATQAACQAKAAIDYPGYSSYTCTGTGVSTNLGATSCYASQAACTTATAALFPGYSAVSCASPVPCTADLATTAPCAANTAYNTAAKCTAGAPAFFSAPYATYSCTAGANCAGGKIWTITGANNKYTATGTATAWTVTGTTAPGFRFDMSGTGGNIYNMKATDTHSSWITYGNQYMTMSIPTGTATSISPNNADEWAKFLYQTDVSPAPGQQNVMTYTIDVFKDQQDTEQTKLLMSMARVGGGKYFAATNEEGIKNALRTILAEIQSVNSVFASSSLPISVNTQGTYLNQVFMGMFRPRGDAAPRWMGNLKQYKMGFIGGDLKLVDKFGDEATSYTTGFISPCADSFWSSDTRTYWLYSGSGAKGNCRAQMSGTIVSYYSDAPDGHVVEKGGVAQKLRGTTLSGTTLLTSTNYLTRKLLTCAGACGSFSAFDTSNAALTPAAFGIGSMPAYYQSTFINWVRGQDVDDERVNNLLTEVRPSVHGGVIHSQPAVVDYGGTTGVVAYYGSDDGIFHAIDGGQTDAEGTELWGFIAPEHYNILHRLRDNGTSTPRINFPLVGGSVAPKQYGFDGGIGVYQQAGQVWIFPTQRRGGRAVYGFDVSDPANPSIKWRKGCFSSDVASTNCSAGSDSNGVSWSDIGQTWSKPKVVFLKGSSNPVLIFGGGYDTCEDADMQKPCAAGASKGANIWFVDADTGSIIRTYRTHYSVPGEVATVNDADGNVTQVYVGDNGGFVYRINVGGYSGGAISGVWSPNGAATDIDIAELSEPGNARKFQFGPVAVKQYGFNAVLLGSGDREHPLMDNYACAGGGVKNQFYMLMDKPTDPYPEPPVLAAQLADVTAGSATFDKINFKIIPGSPPPGTPADSTFGWRFDFGLCEQSVNQAVVIGGWTYFGTNAPATASTACETDLGKAYGYRVNFLTGNAFEDSRALEYIGGGMPPSPVVGLVDIGGEKIPFCIGCRTPGCTGPGCTTRMPLDPPSNRIRTYWYIEND